MITIIDSNDKDVTPVTILKGNLEPHPDAALSPLLIHKNYFNGSCSDSAETSHESYFWPTWPFGGRPAEGTEMLENVPYRECITGVTEE